MAYADVNARHGSAKKKDTGEFRLIFAIAFIVFFIGALVSRFMPRSWLGAGNTERKSVFAEAKSKALGFVPFAFMG